MLAPYEKKHYREVKRFAARQKNFFYVRDIIRWHLKEKFPGGCYVWQEDGRVVAFQSVAYLNESDAWLWGMRVDPGCRNHGIATRFTRSLFPVIKRDGRSWVGLNTLDRAKPAPTIRVMDKLGMEHVCTHSAEFYWRRPRRAVEPRLKRFPHIFDHFRRLGQRVLFRMHPGILWYRLLPVRRVPIDRGGYTLDGVPLHLARLRPSRLGWHRQQMAVNLFDRPPSFREFVPRLLALVSKQNGPVVLNYPAEWARSFRTAARRAIPGLRRNHGCWYASWRIYGKKL